MRSSLFSRGRPFTLLLIAFLFAYPAWAQTQVPSVPGRHRISVISSSDRTPQPSYLILPDDFRVDGDPVPLVVSLHSWSRDMDQREPYVELERLVADRGWLYLFPHFRGRHNHPLGCGSQTAQQDILDALDWVREHYPVDRDRIYLTGMSGGGYMTMLMAGLYPDRWTAASAWVGISDLPAWYERHTDDRFSTEMRACFGGGPTESPEIRAEYEKRSPLAHLSRAKDVALDLAAGQLDGHGDNGPVPISHTLNAFNVIATAVGGTSISEQEIAELARADGYLGAPLPSDTVSDDLFGRKLYLRRTAGLARVTIFQGGHEWIPGAVVAWFEEHDAPRR